MNGTSHRGAHQKYERERLKSARVLAPVLLRSFARHAVVDHGCRVGTISGLRTALAA